MVYLTVEPEETGKFKRIWLSMDSDLLSVFFKSKGGWCFCDKYYFLFMCKLDLFLAVAIGFQNSWNMEKFSNQREIYCLSFERWSWTSPNTTVSIINSCGIYPFFPIQHVCRFSFSFAGSSSSISHNNDHPLIVSFLSHRDSVILHCTQAYNGGKDSVGLHIIKSNMSGEEQPTENVRRPTPYT